MPESTIICLANSRKRAGRCIVGLRADGGGWVRPVSLGPEGTLFPEHFTLKDGTEPQVLDVLVIPLERPKPELHQPENWVIGGGRWRLVERNALQKYWSFLESHKEHGPDLFGDQSYRIPFEDICSSPVEESVVLIAPRNLRWQIAKGYSGRRQARAIFRLGKATYNLPVTDPIWEERLGELPYGNHRLTSADIRTNDKILLTISLGEPFQNDFCYKLIAAIIVFPVR